MQLIVYLVLFIIFSPRYFFSLAKTGNRITYKEVISHAAVFGFAVVILQWVSKRYGILEGFTKATESAGKVAPGAGKPAPSTGKTPTYTSTMRNATIPIGVAKVASKAN